MRKIILLLSIFAVSFGNAQSIDPLGKIPEFLTQSPKEELIKVFDNPAFFRFSSTLPQGIKVAYENSFITREGSLDNIFGQIEVFRNQLLAARSEKPKVEFFQWADCEERIEIYPCGLVAVFRNNRLGEVWIDLQ
jgi:hypothetical protein